MYKQLTSSQRYVIKNGLKENVPLRKIARLIGVSPSTVSREIKRNSSKTGVFISAIVDDDYGTVVIISGTSKSYTCTGNEIDMVVGG